jgi:hypothetical protein
MMRTGRSAAATSARQAVGASSRCPADRRRLTFPHPRASAGEPGPLSRRSLRYRQAKTAGLGLRSNSPVDQFVVVRDRARAYLKSRQCNGLRRGARPCPGRPGNSPDVRLSWFRGLTGTAVCRRVSPLVRQAGRRDRSTIPFSHSLIRRYPVTARRNVFP